MTKHSCQAMSHAIDVLIAEHVLGWEQIGDSWWNHERTNFVDTDIKKFNAGFGARLSSLMDDAMLVVDCLKRKVESDSYSHDGFRMEWDGEQWDVGFTESMDADCSSAHFEFDHKGNEYHRAKSYGPCSDASLPMAICLYALKVYGIPIPSPGAPRASNPKASPGDTGG